MARRRPITDKVIGLKFLKGRAGHGVALVHERREVGERSDTVETYFGPVLRGATMVNIVGRTGAPPAAMIQMVVDGMEYIQQWLEFYEPHLKK